MTNRVFDLNGWYEVKDNPLSLAGVFPYLGRSIGAPEPDRIYMVFRPPEELANDECIASFKLLPWVDDHTMIGGESTGFTPAEEKGVHGVIGEEVYFADGTLYGNIKVFSDALAGLIESGKKELSCGYRCSYEYAPGAYQGQPYDFVQRNIRGNHLALVESGRMGKEVAVLDHFTFSVDSKEFEIMSEKDDKGGAVSVDLAAVVEQLKAIAPQVQELMTFMQKLKPLEQQGNGVNLDDKGGGETPPASAAAAKTEDEEHQGMDAALKIVGDLATQLKAAQDSIDDLRANGVKSAMTEIAKRDAMASKLAAHVGTFDHSAMTEAEVAKYGVEKLGIACDSGAEVAALQGYLHAAKPADVGFSFDHKQAPRSSELQAYLNNK